MVEPGGASGAAASKPGLLRHVAAFFASFSAYFRARLELAGIEAAEAGVHYAKILAFAVVALVLVIFGYFFFVLAIVFAVALAFGGGNAWIWVTLATALIHFGGALGLLLLAKSQFAERMFAATLAEFQKDKAWLITASAKPR